MNILPELENYVSTAFDLTTNTILAIKIRYAQSDKTKKYLLVLTKTFVQLPQGSKVNSAILNKSLVTNSAYYDYKSLGELGRTALSSEISVHELNNFEQILEIYTYYKPVDPNDTMYSSRKIKEHLPILKDILNEYTTDD